MPNETYADAPDRSNGDRATVALVYHATGEIKALLELQAKITETGFKDVQRQLDTHARITEALPVAVSALAERTSRLEMLVTDVENELDKREKEVIKAAREVRNAAIDKRAWWRTYTLKDLPLILVALGAFTLSVVQSVH
jgi:hypothetical protein